MSMNQPPAGGLAASGLLTLNYPMSLGVYDEYGEAQKAVDYLADHEFPVRDVMIVGTDLRQVERVTGRITTGRVLAGGLLSGIWIGVFVGLIFAMFEGGESLWARLLSTVAIGAVFGLVWAWIGYRATGGQRDFSSIAQVVATKYEVLVEHKHIERGRELLAELDPMRAAQDRARRMQERAAEQAARSGQAGQPGSAGQAGQAGPPPADRA
ncbi:hypothetical protein GCM10027055_16930 [Janibacter alkaliphilus]